MNHYALIFRLPNLGSPPVLQTIALPSAITGIYYNVELESDGAVRWVIASGSLPAGLSLNSTTGTISGTPTVATGGTTSSFAIKISNSYGSITVALSIEIEWSSLYDYMMGDVAAGHVPYWYYPNEASGNVINRGSFGANADLTVVGTPLRQQDSPLGAGTALDFPAPGSTGTYITRNFITGIISVLPRYTLWMLYKPRSQGASSAGLMCFNASGEFKFGGNDNYVTINQSAASGTAPSTSVTIASHLNNWHLVFWTYNDEGDRKLHGYRALSGTVAEFTTTMTAATGVLNAMNSIRAAYRYNGLISAFGYETRVLTIEQMQEMHNLVFGAGTAETYSAAPLAVDPAFSYAALSEAAQGYYDDMWTAINDANEYPNADTLVTYSNYSYNPAIAATSYLYGLGYGWRYVLFAYSFAFLRTGEQALFDEIDRLCEIIAPNVGDVEVIGNLYESMYQCTLAMQMLLYYANRSHATNGATYTTRFEFWRDTLLARISANGLAYSTLAHSSMSAMFTAFALYLVGQGQAYLTTARYLRSIWQSEVSALSPAGRVVWYHRFPRSAGTTELFAQAFNYADYTVDAVVMAYELGFLWYLDMSGYDMARLAGTLLHMTAGGNTCTSDVDGGDAGGTEPAFVTPDLYSIRTLSILARFDVSGELFTRSAAIRALSTYPLRKPAIPACLLYASP